MNNEHLVPGNVEVIDVQAYAKEGKDVPKGARYRIRVDKEHFDVSTGEISGREVLETARKLPVERFRLDLKLRGGATRKVELDEVVDLTAPGIERFMTLPLDQTEG